MSDFQWVATNSKENEKRPLEVKLKVGSLPEAKDSAINILSESHDGYTPVLLIDADMTITANLVGFIHQLPIGALRSSFESLVKQMLPDDELVPELNLDALVELDALFEGAMAIVTNRDERSHLFNSGYLIAQIKDRLSERGMSLEVFQKMDRLVPYLLSDAFTFYVLKSRYPSSVSKYDPLIDWFKQVHSETDLGKTGLRIVIISDRGPTSPTEGIFKIGLKQRCRQRGISYVTADTITIVHSKKVK